MMLTFTDSSRFYRSGFQAMLGGLLWMLAGQALAAGERVDETRDASPDGSVRVTVVRGDVEIEGWDKDQIRVTGTLDEQAEEFIFDVRRNDAVIEVKLPRNLNSWCCEDGSELTIMVPKLSRLDVSVVSADVSAEDIGGGIDINGVSGDVRVNKVSGRIEITSVSGEVDLRDANGRVEVKTVSGDIVVYDATPEVQMHTVSGDIIARSAGIELDVESVSGDIELEDVEFHRLEGHTVSGDADVTGTMRLGGNVEFDSVSGSVRVRFRGDVDAHFDLETASGSIRNRLTKDRPETSKYQRDETLRFTTGKGQGEVVIGSRSGDLVVERD